MEVVDIVFVVFGDFFFVRFFGNGGVLVVVIVFDIEGFNCGKR